MGGGGMSMQSSTDSFFLCSWTSSAKNNIEPNMEEMGCTMWLLMMANAAEQEHWISSIKSAVLMQQ